MWSVPPPSRCASRNGKHPTSCLISSNVTSTGSSRIVKRRTSVVHSRCRSGRLKRCGSGAEPGSGAGAERIGSSVRADEAIALHSAPWLSKPTRRSLRRRGRKPIVGSVARFSLDAVSGGRDSVRAGQASASTRRPVGPTAIADVVKLQANQLLVCGGTEPDGPTPSSGDLRAVVVGECWPVDHFAAVVTECRRLIGEVADVGVGQRAASCKACRFDKRGT
jgi:hypothetical protein